MQLKKIAHLKGSFDVLLDFASYLKPLSGSYPT